MDEAGKTLALAQLSRIKKLREDRAERALAQQRQAEAQARAGRAAARQTRAAHREEARAHEDRCFTDLCSRVVRLDDLEEVQHALALDKQRDVSLDQQFVSSAEQSRDARALLVERRRERVIAWRAAKKVSEQQTLAAKAAALRAELDENNTLEAASELLPNRMNQEDA